MLPAEKLATLKKVEKVFGKCHFATSAALVASEQSRKWGSKGGGSKEK